MAELSITVGALSSSVPADDTKAGRVLKKAALRLGYAGSLDDNQAVLDYVVARGAAWLRDTAAAQVEDEALAQARSDSKTNSPEWET